MTDKAKRSKSSAKDKPKTEKKPAEIASSSISRGSFRNSYKLSKVIATGANGKTRRCFTTDGSYKERAVKIVKKKDQDK